MPAVTPVTRPVLPCPPRVPTRTTVLRATGRSDSERLASLPGPVRPVGSSWSSESGSAVPSPADPSPLRPGGVRVRSFRTRMGCPDWFVRVSLFKLGLRRAPPARLICMRRGPQPAPLARSRCCSARAAANVSVRCAHGPIVRARSGGVANESAVARISSSCFWCSSTIWARVAGRDCSLLSR
jgi:hypothetical protein